MDGTLIAQQHQVLFRRVRQIDEIVGNRRVCRILNYNSELVDIVHLLGPPVEKYYTLKN